VAFSNAGHLAQESQMVSSDQQTGRLARRILSPLRGCRNPGCMDRGLKPHGYCLAPQRGWLTKDADLLFPAS
jgi:hypothetical protein